jgi:hypothetical protein
MIDIISLEKVLVDFIKVINNKELKNFKKIIFGILNSEDIDNSPKPGIPNKIHINSNKNNTNICNYPRTKNRGPCKRRCINSIHCIYHKNKNTTKEYIDKINNFHVFPSIPDIIPCNNILKSESVPELLEYNEIDESIQYNKIIFPKLNNNVKIKNKKCLFMEDIQNTINNLDNQVNPCNSDKNNLHVYSKNTPILKKNKKKKKNNPRYIKEYNILCKFYDSKIKSKIYKYNINIRTRFLINKILNYEENKSQNKNELSDMLFSAINTISVNEILDKLNDDLKHLISYIYALADVLKTDNYNDEDFNNMKKNI